MGRKKLTTDDFIEKAIVKHGLTYNYTMVNYINTKEKVCIICSEHDEFKQTPAMHLSGRGCPSCGESKKGPNMKTTEEFISESIYVHSNKYSYSHTTYKGYFNKVSIICEKHGGFKQTPSDHLQGYGCPICKESKGERTVRNFLIENDIKFISQHKFNDCVDKDKLPFDFYLPEHNMCIEYDGVQHFKPKSLFGGEIGLKDRQKKDNIKSEYCYKNGINLLRINYKENAINKLKSLL